MLTEADYGYLAGIIDGEGYIGITVERKNGRVHLHRLQVVVAMTAIPAMQVIAERWGKQVQLVKAARSEWKDYARITWLSGSAAALLRQVRPYLLVKAAEADIALAFAATMNLAANRSARVTPERWAERERLRVALTSLHGRAVGAPALKVNEKWDMQPTYTRTCTICGTAYTAHDARSMYCSPICRRRAAYGRDYQPKLHEKNCLDCGKTYQTKRPNQQYCSPKCGPHGRNSKRGLEPVSVKHAPPASQ